MQQDQKPQGFRDPVHAVVRPAQLLLMNDLFQIPIKKFPKPWMAFYQAGNIAKVFELLTLSSFGIAPGFDFSS